MTYRLLNIRHIQNRGRLKLDDLEQPSHVWGRSFYRKKLKKFRSIRAICLNVYFNYYMPARRIYFLYVLKNYWYKFITYSDWEQAHPLNIKELAESCRVFTPDPIVYPNFYSDCLVSPHKFYSFPKVRCLDVESADIVGGTNLVFVGRNVICHDLYNFDLDYTSEELHGRHVINSNKDALSLTIKTASCEIVPRAAIFLDACATNYAHWLTELLPRIAVFCANDKNKDIPLVVDDRLHNNILSSLFAIVGNEREILQISIGQKITVMNLTVVSVAGYVPFERRSFKKHGHSHGKFSSSAINLMREAVFDKIVQGSQSYPDKIYIRRKSDLRNIVNITEIESELQAYNYITIEPEKLSFSEQVRIFSKAKSIVGSSGAALANIVFAAPGANIIIMIGRDKNTSYFYWQNIACASGSYVKYILGEAVNNGIHSDYRVSKKSLIEAITER